MSTLNPNGDQEGDWVVGPTPHIVPGEKGTSPLNMPRVPGEEGT